MVDITKLEEKLNGLRGLDFDAAEAQERAAGNNYPDVSFTKGFQIRLAAIALGVTPAELKELPLRQYARLCTRVSAFLFGSLEDETVAE